MRKLPVSTWCGIYVGDDACKDAARSYFGQLAEGYDPIVCEGLENGNTDRMTKMRMWGKNSAGEIREFNRTFGRTLTIGSKVADAASLKHMAAKVSP